MEAILSPSSSFGADGPMFAFTICWYFTGNIFSFPTNEAVAWAMWTACLHSGGTRVSITVAKVSQFEAVSAHNNTHPLIGMWQQLSCAYMFDF